MVHAEGCDLRAGRASILPVPDAAHGAGLDRGGHPMKKLVLSVLFASALAPAAALACPGAEQHQVQTVSAEQGAQFARARQATFVDANSNETRAKHGIVEGAVLLTSASKFAAAELPKNSGEALVFYCANERCGSAKMAAERAMEAGYKDVFVMSVGIEGWKAAGNKTVPAPKAAAARPAKIQS
jgi:rhodanese-related sulfurtransferase